ncbi:unnamed protein product [Pieris macdunnoughi]|uniref:Uncharacterized protein n=1 Tax=Pieris macdunnoughi TaxID=345717 RepID=A0A821WZP5_9NEOP|nr:unnamed protein product [Pieris macdunnoughi]
MVGVKIAKYHDFSVGTLSSRESVAIWMWLNESVSFGISAMGPYRQRRIAEVIAVYASQRLDRSLPSSVPRRREQLSSLTYTQLSRENECSNLYPGAQNCPPEYEGQPCVHHRVLSVPVVDARGDSPPRARVVPPWGRFCFFCTFIFLVWGDGLRESPSPHETRVQEGEPFASLHAGFLRDSGTAPVVPAHLAEARRQQHGTPTRKGLTDCVMK